MTTVLLAHRWSGSPEADWYPWLKRELEGEDVNVLIPRMPNPHEPEIESWVSTLQKALPRPDDHTYLVGHSIGCQTILRYIETIPSVHDIAGLILVAPWTHLKPQSYEKEEDIAIASPWIETPLHWKKIYARAQNTNALFSTDDPYVDYVKESQIFREKLNANIFVKENMGHFTVHDQVTKLDDVFHTIQSWGIMPERTKLGTKKNGISDE